MVDSSEDEVLADVYSNVVINDVSTAKKDGGSKAKKDDGSKAKKDGGSTAKKDDGSTAKKDDAKDSGAKKRKSDTKRSKKDSKKKKKAEKYESDSYDSEEEEQLNIKVLEAPANSAQFSEKLNNSLEQRRLNPSKKDEKVRQSAHMYLDQFASEYQVQQKLSLVISFF